MCADLAQQHRQNEQIRKDCELQRKIMTLQQAAMELQRESSEVQIQEAIRRLSPLQNR